MSKSIDQSEAKNQALVRRDESPVARYIAPQVVGARLCVEALFVEWEWNPVVGRDSVTVASAVRRATVRFVADDGGVFVQIGIILARSIESAELQELFATPNAPAFKVGCLQTPDGAVVLHSDAVFPLPLPLREFVDWFYEFHVFAAPLFDGAHDQP